MPHEQFSGRIIRFHFICKNYMKGCVQLDHDDSFVYVLVRKDFATGKPQIDKNADVMWINDGRHEYKGHVTTGYVVPLTIIPPVTEDEPVVDIAQDFADATDWGVDSL